MNKYIEQLVALSKIDQDIDNFEPRIAGVTKVFKESQVKIDKINDSLLKCDEEIQELKNQQNQNNIHISEFSAKIKDLSKKSASVKNEREANALKLEEDIAREQLSVANEEISRLDKMLISKEDLKKELLQDREKEELHIQTIKADIDKELKEIEKERVVVYNEKEKLVANINQKILIFYEKIRKWAKNTAVVPIKKQACYGCFMRIQDKTNLALLKGDEIVTCPHCGRILYKENSKV